MSDDDDSCELLEVLVELPWQAILFLLFMLSIIAVAWVLTEDWSNAPTKSSDSILQNVF